jgi:hypothetical protein
MAVKTRGAQRYITVLDTGAEHDIVLRTRSVIHGMIQHWHEKLASSKHGCIILNPNSTLLDCSSELGRARSQPLRQCASTLRGNARREADRSSHATSSVDSISFELYVVKQDAGQNVAHLLPIRVQCTSAQQSAAKVARSLAIDRARYPSVRCN